jgi:putative ABC transport system substrate-binding protein
MKRGLKGWSSVFVLMFVALTLTGPAATESSGADRPFKIGIVLPGDEWLTCVDGFKQGMKDLGYIERKNIVYLFDNAKGDKARVAELTRTYLAEKVDVVFTVTNTALKNVAELARPSKTPVVFGSAAGPVESGIVPAYATPDTHMTGITSASIELVEKRLEILREILPSTKKVAVFGDLEADSSKAAFVVAEKTAKRIKLNLLEIKIRSAEEGISSAKKTTRKDADAFFLLPGLFNVSVVDEVAAVTKANRMPFAAYQIEHVKKNGALLSYGASYFLQGKQSAVLVDKILKGRPVYELPIERPGKHELVLNLDVARAIGVRFSAEILSRADEIVGQQKAR